MNELPVLQTAFDAANEYLFPDGYQIGFDDTHPSAVPKEVVAFQKNPSCSPFFYAPNASWLVARSGMDRTNDVAFALNASLSNHMHANGISLELYARGYRLAPDAGVGWSLYSGDDYKEYYSQFPAHYPNDLTFASRTVNGVNFVAADDVYYNFTEEQLRLMEQEVAKGLPIVFMCHVPLYSPKHYVHQMQRTGGTCAYETGVPDTLMKTWKGGAVDPSNWRDRRVQQRTDAATAEFIAYLKSQSLVKALLCGHCHEFWEERFSPTAMMYIADATYRGGCTEIEFT